MQGTSPEKKAHKATDDRDCPIEAGATGVTSGGTDPVPTADPDPRRPPYEGPRGGKGPGRP